MTRFSPKKLISKLLSQDDEGQKLLAKSTDKEQEFAFWLSLIIAAAAITVLVAAIWAIS